MHLGLTVENLSNEKDDWKYRRGVCFYSHAQSSTDVTTCSSTVVERCSVESRKGIKTLVWTGIDVFLMETKTHPFENAFFFLSTGPKSLSSSVCCYHVQCGIVFFLFAVYLSIGNINFIFIVDITSPVTMFHANLMPVITISKWKLHGT